MLSDVRIGSSSIEVCFHGFMAVFEAEREVFEAVLNALLLTLVKLGVGE